MIRVKVCGLTKAEDYLSAVAAGVDFTGFIFYQKSLRGVSVDQVKKILVGAPNKTPPKVGVFVNEAPGTIRRIVKDCGLDFVQLHGDEDAVFADALGLPYWKVIRLKEEGDLKIFEAFRTDTFLIDAFHRDLYGGTGERVDFEFLKKALARAANLGKKVMVAGGLDPENVEEVLALKPFGIDLNSGVETKPGLKDLAKIRAVISERDRFQKEQGLRR